jgi:glyoxylase-like metal-dependent hydrolase (beta-lactamase superfamily II)
VAEGVHRIPLALPLDGLRAINVYVIEDGDRLVIVDTGPRHHLGVEALQQGLAALDATIDDIGLVIATHGHYDHYGLAAQIRATSGAPVLLGTKELELLSIALEDGKYERWTAQRRVWLGSHGAREILDDVERVERRLQSDSTRGFGSWEPPDRLLQDGELIELQTRSLRAHLTPGHTRGHLVFHDEANGILFAGDHVLPHITPSLGFEPLADGRALELFLDSLRAVRDLPVGLVLPGHGPVFEDLPGRVDELLLHHRERLSECVAAIDGVTSANTVAGRLSWTSRDTPFTELDPLNRMLAVTETVTHLEFLVHRHELDRRTRGEGIGYALAA